MISLCKTAIVSSLQRSPRSSAPRFLLFLLILEKKLVTYWTVQISSCVNLLLLLNFPSKLDLWFALNFLFFFSSFNDHPSSNCTSSSVHVECPWTVNVKLDSNDLKFKIGLRTGWNEDPNNVAESMISERNSDRSRWFTHEEIWTVQ